MPFHSLKKVQLSHGVSNDIALGEVCQGIIKGAYAPFIMHYAVVGMTNSLRAFQYFAFVAQVKFAPFV